MANKKLVKDEKLPDIRRTIDENEKRRDEVVQEYEEAKQQIEALQNKIPQVEREMMNISGWLTQYEQTKTRLKIVPSNHELLIQIGLAFVPLKKVEALKQLAKDADVARTRFEILRKQKERYRVLWVKNRDIMSSINKLIQARQQR